VLTIDATGVSVTVAKTDNTMGLLERDLTTLCVLQVASWEIYPILKEALVKLTSGRRPITTWVFVANITEFFLGLDVMHDHDASVNWRRRVLQQR
jgi:hypothetical protein